MKKVVPFVIQVPFVEGVPQWAVSDMLNHAIEARLNEFNKRGPRWNVKPCGDVRIATTDETFIRGMQLAAIRVDFIPVS